MRYLLPVLGAILLLIVACQTPVTLEQPKVSWNVLDQGGTLELLWDAIDDADGYKVYYDGSSSADTALTTTKIRITEPHKTIKIEAYNGTEVNDSTLNVGATGTVTTLNVNGISAGITNAAYGFNTTSGIATAMDAAVGPNVDFVMEDRAPDPMSFWSPTSYDPVLNNKDNAASLATGITDPNALKVCAAPGNYNTKTQISENAVYSLWIDVTGDGYSTDDHFGKAQVVDINGTAVVLKVSYQKIAGLRWIYTE